MPRFVVAMWTPRPKDATAGLEAASLRVADEPSDSPPGAGTRFPTREIRAVVDAASPSAARIQVRAAVGDVAAVVGVEQIHLANGVVDVNQEPSAGS